VTEPAASPQQPQPSGPTPTDEPYRGAIFRPPEAPDTWTADATWPADSPIPYTLTPKAETALGKYGYPTHPLRNTQACDMRTRPPQARPGLSGQPVTYVTEISMPPRDSGIHRLHVRMKEPEPEPEAGL
jgi:hypothetical protein